MAWLNDVDDAEAAENDESEQSATSDSSPSENGQSPSETNLSLTERLEQATEEQSLDGVDNMRLVNNIEEINDEELLDDILSFAEGDKADIIERRVEDFTEEIEEEAEEEDTSETSPPIIESVDEMGDSSDEEEEKDDTDANVSLSEESEGIPVPEGATSANDLAQRERRWKILVWGQPGLFKTHFACSMPDPIAFIDLEGKAQDTIRKFKHKEIQVWEPTSFREAQKDLKKAIEWLEACQEQIGETGTIVIDSMSLLWEWAKTAYKSEAYPMKDNEDITLTSNLGKSSDSDWPHIKGMHNSEFREWITESDFHFLWTAGESEDYNRVLSGDVDSNKTPMTDEGEKNNQHKADSVIRARHDNEKNKVGDLTKSNFTNNKFVGMKNPTFEKFSSVIESLEEAESSTRDVSRGKFSKEHGVEIISGKPSQFGE